MGRRYGFRVGRSAVTKVFVEPDDEALLVGSPLLKPWAEIPYDAIAAVVHQRRPERDRTFYSGSPRHLALMRAAAPNLVIVLARPVLIDRFTFGAENGLAISAKERRRGVEVDVVTTSVDDPDGLVADLRAHGVPIASTASEAMRTRFGVAVGDEAEAAEAEQRRAQRWIRLGGPAMAGLTVAVLVGTVHVAGLVPDEEVDPVVVASGVALAFAVGGVSAMVAHALSPPATEQEAGKVVSRTWAAVLVGGTALLLVAGALAVVSASVDPALALAPAIGWGFGGPIGPMRRILTESEATGPVS